MNSGMAAAPAEELEAEAAPAKNVWRAIIETREGKVGLILLAVMALLVAVGPYLAPYSPTTIGSGPPLTGPSLHNLLGTDDLGRDVLSRVLHGGRQVIAAPLLIVALALAIGGGLGMWAAYARGVIDAIVSRFFDAILTLPPLLVVLVLLTGLGTSTEVLILSVTFIYIPRIGRVVRAATQQVAASDYIAAALARGETTLSILLREIAPNIAGPVIAEVALRITFAILFVATLDFLGLGTQPPSSDWGLMVAESRSLITIVPLPALVPAAGIALLSISVALIADALTKHIRRETVEPHL